MREGDDRMRFPRNSQGTRHPEGWNAYIVNLRFALWLPGAIWSWPAHDPNPIYLVDRGTMGQSSGMELTRINIGGHSSWAAFGMTSCSLLIHINEPGLDWAIE